jgi:hypothetical protein
MVLMVEMVEPFHLLLIQTQQHFWNITSVLTVQVEMVAMEREISVTVQPVKMLS